MSSPRPIGARPRVSLLMPNRDNEATLELVLGKLAQHTRYPDLELVVVDDGSQDASREILRRWRDSGRFPGTFKLIEQEPSGVVVALNRGLQEATGEIVVQLDADATVETPDWLLKMLAFFLSDERIGVVTPKVIMDYGLVHAYGVNAISPAGLHDRGSEITEPVGKRKLHQRVRRAPERPGDLGETAAEVDCGIGCCMMYRRDVALEVGGYDMGFQPVWFDDLDLCLMIRRAGYKVFFIPDVRVLHRLSMRDRGPEAPTVPWRVALGRARARVGKALPPRVVERVVHAADLDKPPAAQLERLRHHYAYWRDKWGWDPLNPDMGEIRRRYGDTELCWASDPARRAAGEEIIRAARGDVDDAGEAGKGVGAVLVTYNRRDLLRESLQAVLGQTQPPDHVIVVDNASTDGTPEMLADEFPQVELLRLQTNEGASGGFHEAIAAGLRQGFEWLWTLDDDTLPEPDALERLLDARAPIDGDPEPVLLYGRVLWTDGKLHPMNLPHFDARVAQTFIDGIRRGRPPLRWATFPSLLIRADAVRRNRLPRKAFFLWSDDIDFTARILREEPGYFVPESVAIHKTATAHHPYQGGPRFYYAIRNGIWIMRGDALDPLELLGHAVLIGGQTLRFLRYEKFKPSAFAIVLRGVRDGLLRRAK